MHKRALIVNCQNKCKLRTKDCMYQSLHHRPYVQGHDSSHDGTGYHQIRTNKDKDKDVSVSSPQP